METNVELELLRAELGKEIFSADFDLDIEKKLLDYLKKLLSKKAKKVDYYDSEQFYKDIDEAEQQIKDGKNLEITTEEELDKLIFE